MPLIDLVIVGGGSAGMAAAIEAKKSGIDSLIILEKDETLGGILNQCIHNGFGLTEFKEELSGPEYLQRFVDQVSELNIPYKLNSQVIDISQDKVVTYSNSNEGTVEIQTKAIIIATGCYERSAGAINLPGSRCSGIMTAGTAQKYLNIHGFLCGKKVVILGSGDIGLIMARRLTLEGAKVLCVSELMPYSNGLNRNIVQCLNDYDIPLYLSRSVSNVIGKNRVEKVVLSAVDEKSNFIPGTEMEIECDTLILSVGLIPYLKAVSNLNIDIASTKGAKVNQNLESSMEGVFFCGNCLHVHDVVDFVTQEARDVGKNAAHYIKHGDAHNSTINVVPGNGVNYVLPQLLTDINKEKISFKFRVKRQFKDANILFKCGDTIISKIVKNTLIPSEMIIVDLNKEKLDLIKGNSIMVEIEQRVL